MLLELNPISSQNVVIPDHGLPPPAHQPDVDASSLHLLYPMIKTPKWFETYSDAMQSYGCQDSIVRRKVKVDASVKRMMLTIFMPGEFRDQGDNVNK
jgi:hypothetical protein